nr:MAG TPA: hypothetical protein [Caudoviricetes sp.]DAU71679.1 MAG TPA: hypothetical protein [Caudoviricetes sp.]
MVRKWLRKLILWALGDTAEVVQEQTAQKIFSEWLNGPED